MRAAVGAPAGTPLPVVALAAATMRGIDQVGADPAFSFDPTTIRHGAQHLVVHRAVAAGAILDVRTLVVDVVPYGTGRALVVQHAIGDPEGALAEATTLLAVGDGPALTADEAPELPSRSTVGTGKVHDVVIDAQRVAAWCRAVGDDNPLHHDLEAAVRAGLPGPMVPGWLTLGIAMETARAVGLAAEEPAGVEVVARFSRPVPVGTRVLVAVARGEPDGIILGAQGPAGSALKRAWMADRPG